MPWRPWGCRAGRYVLGDHEVIVTEREARLASGTLAGSIVGMDEALRRLIRYAGAPLSGALATVTATPADLLGIGHERGRIQPGAYADLVFLTPDLQVVKTMVEGRLVYEHRGRRVRLIVCPPMQQTRRGADCPGWQPARRRSTRRAGPCAAPIR